ncbi:MAG: DUF1761 domain-containing protein [Verrucomicrobiota bacterium]|nr:DUF1761 domain-containing protein [Verrucomicrobiota bacterium]
MESVNVDALSILVATVLYMAINFFWFSKWLFGKAWLELSKVTKKDMRANKLAMVWGFLVALVIAYFIAFFESALYVSNAMDGMFMGFCVWLGFVATTQVSSVIWGKKPFKLFIIEAGAKLVSFLAMSGVIGA